MSGLRSSLRDAQPFPRLTTQLDAHCEAAQRYRQHNQRLLAQLSDAHHAAQAGGGEKYVTRHLAAGKLLPRVRIELLLDPGSPFLELCPFAGHGISGHATGASVIGGIGRVSGLEVMVIASEATVKGGALNEMSVLKSNRLAEIAEENRLPTVNLVESAGADLPNQSKIFVPGGRGFRDLTRRSKARIPSICLVFGSSTAGGAYIPGMSDYVVMVKDAAQVYLAGPPLVKMATGEVVDHETLGGAEMHSRKSGVADYLAYDELDAIAKGREILARLASTGQWPGPPTPALPPRPPLFSADELLALVPDDPKIPWDAREVLARVVDDSRFSEFKPLYGSTLVCGWAHIGGHLVGVLANNGVLFSESAQKGAQFIALCNQTDTPLLFLQNITGFMVGAEVEQGGIIKHGAKLINAVANSTVPAITIMIGTSYGAGNYAMAGRAYAPRFLFSWPNHRIAVMGSQQLAGVLEIIQRDAAAKRNEPLDEQKLAMGKAMVEAQIERESAALYGSARLWDDGVIDPRDTRTVLQLCLGVILGQEVHGTTSWGVVRH